MTWSRGTKSSWRLPFSAKAKMVWPPGTSYRMSSAASGKLRCSLPAQALKTESDATPTSIRSELDFQQDFMAFSRARDSAGRQCRPGGEGLVIPGADWRAAYFNVKTLYFIFEIVSTEVQQNRPTLRNCNLNGGYSRKLPLGVLIEPAKRQYNRNRLRSQHEVFKSVYWVVRGRVVRPLFLRLLLIWAAACSASAAVKVRADFVTLKSGGEIRGEFLPGSKPNASSSHISMRMLSGATVVVHKDEVEGIVRRRPAVEEYHTLRRAMSDTVAGNWELAEWCRRNALPQERSGHLQRVLEIDGEHVLAHRALGHIRDQGRWTTRDELLAAQGFVKHKGKNVLPQELQAADRQERVRVAERSWLKRVKLWQGWLDSGRGERHSAAILQLHAIRDPDA